MDPIHFTTEEGMDNIQSAYYFIENLMPCDWTVEEEDGTYFEVSTPEGDFGCHSTGCGDFFSHKIVFEELEDE